MFPSFLDFLLSSVILGMRFPDRLVSPQLALTLCALLAWQIATLLLPRLRQRGQNLWEIVVRFFFGRGGREEITSCPFCIPSKRALSHSLTLSLRLSLRLFPLRDNIPFQLYACEHVHLRVSWCNSTAVTTPQGGFRGGQLCVVPREWALPDVVCKGAFVSRGSFGFPVPLLENQECCPFFFLVND